MVDGVLEAVEEAHNNGQIDRIVASRPSATAGRRAPPDTRRGQARGLETTGITLACRYWAVHSEARERGTALLGCL